MDAFTLNRATLRSQGKRLIGWGVVVLVVLLTVAVVFLGTPFEAPEDSLDRVENDPGVSVTEAGGGYVLEPAEPSDTGLVFYPGARVAPDAYVESLAPLARDANVTVVIPRFPFNLAIVDYGLARTGLWPHAPTAAMDDHPEIERWYVGGHSLGGAMACRYADGYTDRIEGLVLYGSYCDRDISDSGLAVLSVAGTGDTVIDWNAYERGLDRLPAEAAVTELDGLNHTQFGRYTGQSGDTPTGTSYTEAHARLNEVAVSWFQNETSK
jgi:hypothetical protein